MGSFQITYDDFSGGQYMGPRSTNWPKNTWSGENVVNFPDGRLAPVGAMTAGTYSPGTMAAAQVIDCHISLINAYVFAYWTNGSGTKFPKMVMFGTINDGTLFPITGTPVTLSEVPAGGVVFDESSFLSPCFYYIGSTTNKIYKVLANSPYTESVYATPGFTATSLAMWGQRLIAWGGYSNKLYYSGTTTSSWTIASDYYTFAGSIKSVAVRAQDLIVICDNGVFSLTGVLGSSITNQNISGKTNTMEGMNNSAVVNRNMHFVDQLGSGNLDGRIYVLDGSYIRPLVTMRNTDVDAANAYPYGATRISTITGERLLLTFLNGVAYVETIPGTWTRLKFTSGTASTSAVNQQSIGQPNSTALNEYFLVANIDSSTTAYTLKLDRFIFNVSDLTNKDAKFKWYVSGSATGSSVPTGTVTLPEYWHTKPFTVKEMFIEYESTTASVVTAAIIPTGNVDVLAANVASMISTSESNITQTASTTVLERFLPNNANKGFGVKPYLSITAAIINRVILNCED